MDNQQEVFDSLAYSVGFLLGDGYFYCAQSRGSYQLRAEKPDVECLERVSRQMDQVFGNPGRIVERRRKGSAPIYSLIICCRDAHDWLFTNTSARKEVPPYYLSASADVKREVLAGLMDSDGSAEKNREYITVRFVNTNLDLINFVAGTAKFLGIRHGKKMNQEVGNYKVLHRVTLNTKDFAEKAYFHSVRKDRRLDHYRSREWVEQVLRDYPERE